MQRAHKHAHMPHALSMHPHVGTGMCMCLPRAPREPRHHDNHAHGTCHICICHMPHVHMHIHTHMHMRHATSDKLTEMASRKSATPVISGKGDADRRSTTSVATM